MNTRVLVTGANGQLGKTIKELFTLNEDQIQFIFVTKEELDITNLSAISGFFKLNKFHYCINCAAYTNVEQAEIEPKIAFNVNAEGVKHLAQICKETNTILIHLSTDYVFDGEKNTPYIEEDKTNPINKYGKSKLLGEQYLQEMMQNYFIIRTSWLYSEYGNNFLKKMLKLSEEKHQLNVIYDQISTPTYTNDLTNFIYKIIQSQNKEYGIYHYSNDGIASWYDFAKAIFEISKKDIKTIPLKTDNYSTSTKRPKYSTLDKSKIKEQFKIEIPHWKESLQKTISNL